MEDGGGEREGGGGGGKGRLVPWADYEQGAWRAPGNKSLPPVHKEKGRFTRFGFAVLAVTCSLPRLSMYFRYVPWWGNERIF